MNGITTNNGVRVEERILKSFTISVRYNEKVYSGITQNISKNGLYVETIGLSLNKSKDISVMLAGDDALYRLEGEIMWNKKLTSGGVERSLNGMGVKLISVPSDYLNFIEYQKRL